MIRWLLALLLLIAAPAAADLAIQTGREYAACVGEVFEVLAGIAGVGVHSDALGRLLKQMHEDGSLEGKLAPR